MIIYKRKITQEDIGNLENEEKLIYYKEKNTAFTIDKINDGYLIRKKRFLKMRGLMRFFSRQLMRLWNL